MGLFLTKNIKSSLSRRKLLLSYAAVAGCALLIIINLVFFLSVGKMALWLAVILSNALTILFMLLANRPINSLLQREVTRQAQELLEKEKEENAMKERITVLEKENRELESRLDTWSQTAGMPSNLILTSKIETMSFNKSGYIVKEEPLEQFKEDSKYGLSGKKGFLEKVSGFIDDIANPGMKKVLYIGKYHASATLGLDFEKIHFATRKDTLYLHGISIAKLHDLPTAVSPDDVNHCWLLSGDTPEELSLSLSGSYREFLDLYKAEREKETTEAVEAELDGLCRMYTETFRKSLSQRFPGIVFVDSMEDETLDWQPLGLHLKEERINRIATNMFLMATAVNGYFDHKEGSLIAD